MYFWDGNLLCYCVGLNVLYVMLRGYNNFYNVKNLINLLFGIIWIWICTENLSISGPLPIPSLHVTNHVYMKLNLFFSASKAIISIFQLLIYSLQYVVRNYIQSSKSCKLQYLKHTNIFFYSIVNHKITLNAQTWLCCSV